MYRIIISCVFLVLFSQLSSLAQSEVNIKFSEIFESDKKAIFDLMSTDQDGFITYHSKNYVKGYSKKNTVIERYDQSMKLVNSISYDFNYKGEKLSLIETLDGGDHIKMFFSYSNTDDRTVYIFLRKLDKKTLEFKGKLTKIAERPFAKSFGKDNSGFFNIIFSPDSTKVAFVPRILYDSANNGLIDVYDIDFKEIWKTEYTISEDRKDGVPEEYFIDNEGNVHLYFSKRIKKSEREKGELKDNYFLATINENQTTQRELKIDGHFITDMRIVNSSDENFVFTGFCGESGLGPNGTFFKRISLKSSEDIVITPNIFGFDYISQYASEGRLKYLNKRKANNEPLNLHEVNFNLAFFDQDDNLYQIAEEFYIHVSTGTNAQGNATTTETSVYKSIIIVKYDSEGQLVWKKKIPKSQKSSPSVDDYLSYSFNYINGKMVFLFNDLSAQITNPAHSRTNDMTLVKMKKEGAFFCVVLTADGKVSKDRLIKYDKKTIYTLPKSDSNQVGNKIIVSMKNGKSLQFAKIEVN